MRAVLPVVVSFVWLFSGPSFLLAQSPPPTLPSAQPQTTHLSPVVVTATRTEVPLAETSASVTVVTQEEIQQQQASTVVEALRLVPGLDVVQDGSRGTVADVLIRGGTSNHTLVLIDGVEVNSVTLGSFDFSNLTTENIDRIEVLRGGGGTLYGSHAIGGVINIITKKGEGAPTITISAEGGKGATHRETLSFSGSHGIVGVSGSLASVDTDGFHRFNDGYRNFSTNLRADLDLLPRGAFRNFFRYTDAKIGLFNNKNYLSVPDPNARQLTNSVFWKGEWEHTPFDAFNYRVAGSYVRDNQRFFDEPDQFDSFGSGISRIPIEILTGEFQGNLSWRNLSVITFGFEFEEKSARFLSNFGGLRSDYNTSRHNFAYYLQEQLRLLNERLFITGGFRIDDNEDFGTHITPAGSVAYIFPQTGTKLKGGFSGGFRAPNFNELFYPLVPPQIVSFGNPNLKPEISSEWNAGFEQTLWEQRLSLEAVYFNRRVKGLIEGVLVDLPTFSFQAQNKGRVDIQGVEVIPVLRVLPGLTLSGNFTFLDFDTKDGKLLRRPTKHGSVSVNYERRGLSWSDDLLNLHLNVNVVGERDDVDPVRGTRKNPMFARTNFAASYSFAPSFFAGARLSVYTRIENLFDRNYQEILGFRSPPLNYLLGVKVTF